MPKKSEDVEGAKRLMGALVRMKPKTHEELKGEKSKKAARRTKNPAERKDGK
jgi:hypothetical protein